MGLATTAAELARFEVDSAKGIFLAACMFCTCTMLTATNTQLVEDRPQQVVQTYADEALAFLQQAVAAGYDDVAQLKNNPDLTLLRPREEIRQLLAELEQKRKP